MDARELESRVKALTKTVTANEPPETALKLLETLKKDASPTEEMLRVGRPSLCDLCERAASCLCLFVLEPTWRIASSLTRPKLGRGG